MCFGKLHALARYRHWLHFKKSEMIKASLLWQVGLIANVNHRDHCYHGNLIKSGHYGSAGKIATRFNFYFMAVGWNIPPLHGQIEPQSPHFQILTLPWQHFRLSWILVHRHPKVHLCAKYQVSRPYGLAVKMWVTNSDSDKRSIYKLRAPWSCCRTMIVGLMHWY